MSGDEEFYVKKQPRDNQTLECALVWRGLPPSIPSPIPPVRFGWTETAKSLIDRVRRIALGSGRPEGKEFPYSDLRAALQARVIGMVLLEGRIHSRDQGRPLFAASGKPADVQSAAHRSISSWCQLTLRPWAERLGTDCGDIDLLETRALEGALLEQLPSPVMPSEGQVPDALRTDFHDFADILLAIAAPELEGAELFPGLGPVHRVLDRDYGNSIAFETWPTTLPDAGDDLFSMVAEISVETRPSSRLPYLVVRASKRIWCNEFPAANQLFGRRRISVRVVKRGDRVRATTLSVRLDRGVPKPDLDALLFEAQRASEDSLTEDLPELVRNRGRMPDLFVGVPFRYGYRPVPKIQFGVTLQDQVDLTRVVHQRIARYGFTESRLRVLDRATARPEEFRVQANLHNLITHHFGQVPEEDVPTRVEELFGSAEKKARGRPKPIKTVDLEPLRQANRELLDRAFGPRTGIDLMFVCRRESEEVIFRSAVSLLFGDRINVVRHAIPDGVHGTRKILDGEARLTRTQRAGVRRDAWLPLAEQIRQEFPNSPVIVQAARKYDGIEEDSVNKDVGRNTLATFAGCNVQYLLPPGDGEAADYMHRVQAALYDLLFGHAGLGPNPSELVTSTFDERARPKSIIGISVVSQSASRGGRPEGAVLAVATKIDVATGRISGRIGRLKNGTMDRGAFQTLSRTLVEVASAGLTSLGDKQPDRRKNFLSFVRTVIDEVAGDDPNALILVESTTARSLWTWLADENISSDVYLEDAAARPPASWKSLRFVRVRERSSGRLATESRRNWIPVTKEGNERAGAIVDEVYATAISRVVESLPEGNARTRHYLTAHGFDVRNQGARGQSVYRRKPGFLGANAHTPKGKAKFSNRVLSRRGVNDVWRTPSRIPVTLEITVLPSQLGDDEDSAATLVSALRNGYSHTADGTFLPAPLSFRSKILDYMDRYASAPEDDEPDDGLAIDEDPDLPSDEEPVRSIPSYGETRRWFEGTSDFGEADIPPFEEDSSDPPPMTGPPQWAAIPTGTPEIVTNTETSKFPIETATMAVPEPKVTIEENQGPAWEEAEVAALVRLLRSPSAPLPSFVDEEFLTGAMHLVNSDARRMHENREWIRKVTGFPWPEERPLLQEIPSLYLDALRYPAFAIVFQHQFFPDDNGRGLPKRAIIQKVMDFWSQLRRKKPLPKAEDQLAALRALHSADNGGDKDALLADVLGLPGQAAWRSPCARATAGLDRLEAREGEWGDLGRYLRAVVGQFERFGDERTIGEVIDEIVTPYALNHPEIASIGPTVDRASAVEEAPPAAEVTTDIADVATLSPRSSMAEINEAWSRECDRLLALADLSKSDGPTGNHVSAMRESLEVLENLERYAAELMPALGNTADLREAIRRLTTRISAELNALIGEQLTAPSILSRLFELPEEAPLADLEEATTRREIAESAVADAKAIAIEIADLEATLPTRQARERTTPLLDAQEQSLRRALRFVEEALAIFAAPAEPPDVPPQTTVDAPDPVEPTEDVLASPSPTGESEEEADLPVEATEDEAPEEDIEVAPIVPAPEQGLPDVTPSDPLRNEVAARLDHLFSVGEFGLAFHLSSAVLSMMPQASDTYTPVELRLASAGGRTIGLSSQDLSLLAESRSEALPIAQSLEGLDDDRSVARLSLLIAGALPAALFRSDDVAAVLLVERAGRQPGFEHYRKLLSVVEENRKLNFQLTPANLMAVQAHSREANFIGEAVASIKDTVASLRSARFRFQSGERVRQALLQPDGLLGMLDSRLTENDQAIAHEANELLRGRDKVVAFIAKLVETVGGGIDLDAPSRERIFALLSRVGQQCHDLVQSVDGFAVLRKSASRVEAVKRLRDNALAGISEAISGFHSTKSDPLTASALRQAEAIFEMMRGVLKGNGSIGRDVPPLAVGLHSPLLWLRDLTWTGGWQPSPYVPEKILQEALVVPIPLIGDDPASSIHAAFEARRSESAFVPAYMLLNIAHWFGIEQAKSDAWRAELDADKEAKKHQIKRLLEEAERKIDRMRRMAVGSLEQSARLRETLSTVNPENLPVELPPTFLPETLTGDRIEDFNAALARIHDVETEAEREFDKSMSEYTSSIDHLERDTRLEAETVVELRHLLEGREFTTLADRLNMLRTGQTWKPLLPSGSINWRLSEFRSMLPQLDKVDLLQVARNIELGTQYGPLNYGALDPEHRQQAATIARSFTKLKPPKNASAAQIAPNVSEIVSQLLFEVLRCDEDPLLTRPRQQIFVFDAKVSMPPTDPASLLLPEFGSQTQGSWRMCVVTSAISPQGLLDLADGAGHRGVLVLYRGVLNVERRKQLRLDLIKRKQAMLVVDEAALAFAIADPSDRRRAIIDIAQAYSSADPYKDHGKSAVPAEMFKGRSWERSAIVDPFGSYVVFGGRRLGKTALLQQIHATQPSNAIFAYVDLDLVSDASDAFEQFSKTIGTGVFKTPARSGEEFAAAVGGWLDADDRRRLLLLIDEADRFVRKEAETEFVCVQTLLKLMADTKNRFKFVLAGLHNVSRMVRVENSPLVQISNNPLQIGPLLNRDVDDAEFLVRGPLAAMGFEFDKREDVWRILTFTNYYPVLIQVFCKELLSLIHDQAQKTGQLPGIIGTTLVERALRSADIRNKLFETFYKTIGHIEGRYELLTYILAVRELRERDSGMAAEGMTAAEVTERAMECWPAAFPRGTDPNELEYLLEEMEGFGIARRTVAGSFALRSRSLLELMAATEADLERRLESYKTLKAPPRAFDPKNVRRAIGKPRSGTGGGDRISPLTDGQEADLLAPLQIAADNAHDATPAGGVGVVFGTEYAGVRFVEAALLDARRVKDRLVDVEIKNYESKKDMLDDIKKAIKGQRLLKVVVVSPKTAWRPDWVVEAERVGRVRKGEVRLIFIGDPGHAEEWSRDRTVLQRVLPQIKIVKLRPWARSYLGSRIESLQLAGELVDRIMQATGGWSEIAGPLLSRIVDDTRHAPDLIKQEREAILTSSDLLDRLGIPQQLIGFYRDLAAYADGSTITTTDFQSLCTFDGRNVSPRVVGIYSDLLGIISFPPDQSGQGIRKVDLNALVHAALLRPE
ncbi:uncharacterized protein DUF3893 [Bradyrhizobium huanghuaihaiense]|uniref:Uncharacterized protein DUF3893 n=1 Tax=Bradyrhizobium huanghuaihaiense TaxID=990078 RepID=A0A562S5A7_9BRAD|nr:RNaseH domain-containing protein [Bradyrhizobium huanghuaihaiense]TWI76469.1 uncharacterized protein DUF3893 [Bradyrhizobium huanghuaihaiense]